MSLPIPAISRRGPNSPPVLPPEMPSRQSGAARFRFRETAVMIFLVFTAVLSTLFNYQGLIGFNEVVGALGFVEHAIGFLLAIGVGIALYLAWFLALSIHPESAEQKLVRQGRGLIFATAGFALMVSSSLNLMGLAGGPATVLTLGDHVRAITTETDAAFHASGATDDYLAALTAQNVDLCDAARREESMGGLTRSGGPGVVSATYRSACQQTRTTVGALEAAQTTQMERAEDIRASLDALSVAVSDPVLSPSERVNAYRHKAGALRDLIREGQASGMARTVRLSTQALESLVPPASTLGGYAQEQRNALEGLRHRLDGFVALMLEATTEDQASFSAIAIPDAPTPLEAVFAQLGRTFPFICVAVGIDLASLWFAAWLQINRAQLRSSAAPGRAMKTPAGQARALRTASADAPPWLSSLRQIAGRGAGLSVLLASVAGAAVLAAALMLGGLFGSWDEDPGLVRAFCVFGVETTEEGCPRPAPPPLVKGAVLEQGMAVASTSIIPAGLFRNRGFAACHVDVVRGRDVHTLIATKARGRPPVAEIIGDDALRQLRLSRDELEDAVASCPWSA